MHKIKKNSTIFIVFLILSSSLFALNKNIFDMDTSVNFGLLNGSVNEYVFDEHNKNKDNLTSRLDWDVYFVPFIQGDVNLTFFKYINLGLNGRIGIPTVSGYMQDYDWLNSTPPYDIYQDWLNDDPTELTNYSIHNNEINSFYNLNLTLGLNLKTTEKFTIVPYAGFEFDYIDMSAYGGYRIYKPSPYKVECSGKVISYSQLFYAFTLGFNLHIDFIKKSPIEIGIKLSPQTGYMQAIDFHYVKTNSGVVYVDQYKYVSFYEFNFNWSYQVAKHFSLGVYSFIQYMPTMKGITGNGPLDENGLPPKKIPLSEGAMGGAGRFIYSVSLGAQFRL